MIIPDSSSTSKLVLLVVLQSRKISNHLDREARRILPRNDATVPVIDMLSKTKYLDQFDAAKNGPLHEQVWCCKAMRRYHLDMQKYNQGHCPNCRELCPTTDVTYASPNYVCRRCVRDLLYCGFYRPQLLTNLNLRIHIGFAGGGNWKCKRHDTW